VARRAAARRLADAHRSLGDASMLAFSFASAVGGPAGERPELNLTIVLASLPQQSLLAEVGGRAGATPWTRRQGDLAGGDFAVALGIDDMDARIRYLDRATLDRTLADTTPMGERGSEVRSLADTILRGEALVGHAELERLKARLTRLPPQLACALVKRFLATPTPWRAISQLASRYEMRRCRELQADACYRLCAVRCALSQQYFTRFQVQRTRGLAPRFDHAPAGLAERIERLLEAPARSAFAQLYALEGEVLDQVAREMPQVNLAAVQAQRAAYVPAMA
jgi:hypothetical protein